MKTFYMHTLDDGPASFVKNGKYLASANGTVSARGTSKGPVRLCRSLREIRREQQQHIATLLKIPSGPLSLQTRGEQELGRIDYVRVLIPEGEKA